jgi:hypothetical protein
MSIGCFTNLINLKDDPHFFRLLMRRKANFRSDCYDDRLVYKTLYSAAKNPHNYFSIQAFGVLLHSTRSKFDEFLSDRNTVNNIQNFKCLLMRFFSSSFSLSKPFIDATKNMPETESEELATGDGEPDNPVGLEWYMYFKSFNFRLG